MNGGAWCPQQQISDGVEEWLQVDLRTPHVITSVETQGRYGNGHGLEYPVHFILQYWRPSLDRWVTYRNQTGGKVP